MALLKKLFGLLPNYFIPLLTCLCKHRRKSIVQIYR